MSAVAAPNVEMTVTPNAAEEVKKFMVGYEMFGSPQRDITPEIAAKKLKELI